MEKQTVKIWLRQPDTTAHVSWERELIQQILSTYVKSLNTQIKTTN